MGTHCVLGVGMKNGSIVGCYVHYDGDTADTRIREYLNEKTTTDLTILIARAQATGGMHSFHSPDYKTGIPQTQFLDDIVPYVIDEKNFYEDHMGTFAWYLVDYEKATISKKVIQYD